MKNLKILEHPEQLPKNEERKDIRILPFKEKGIEYTSCFILLNPFYKLHRKKVDFKVKRPKWVEGEKAQILENYQAYYWSDFLKDSGIEDIREIAHCLYVKDHNYVDRFQKVRKIIWEKFNKNIDENQLIPNSDSYISVLLINPILVEFKKLGCEEVVLYDISDDSEQVIKIDRLIKSQKELPSECRLTMKSKEILLYQKYEHYETHIYSINKELLDRFIEDLGLEGFYAEETTTLLWSELEYGEEEEWIKIEVN